MLLPQKVKIKWSNKILNYYENLGYTYTGRGTEFEVDIKHLQKGSNKHVRIQCDYCKEEYNASYNNYQKSIKTGSDCCKNCISKKISVKRKIPNQGNSLAEKYPHLIECWSGKNDKTPWQYNYGSNEKVWWKMECGHEWNAQFPAKGNLKCPKCKEPLGEKKIREYLTERNIRFKQQYSFPDLLSENDYPLKFDFVVFKENKLYCLIEYDGRQHFEPIFGEDNLIITKNRDISKNKYCHNNNIKLIRINYHNYDNIENILKDF